MPRFKKKAGSFMDVWAAATDKYGVRDVELLPYTPFPGGYSEFLRIYHANSVSSGMAEHHKEFWQWIERIRPGETVPARCAFWPRGGGKSTTIELAVAYLVKVAARGVIVVVSATADSATKHLANIKAFLQRQGETRLVSEFGIVEGWNAETLRTASGATIICASLNQHIRGAKSGDRRPDLIIFDDIDELHDTEEATRKKAETLSSSIIPAGSTDCAFAFMQNLIHADSLASQLVDGRADFLHNREGTKVIPAVRDMAYERIVGLDGKVSYRITAGTATWEGQSIAVCEKQMGDSGHRAFLRERQHEVGDSENALWSQALLNGCRVKILPCRLISVAVGYDPSVTSGASADCTGIVIVGLGEDGRYYVLNDLSGQHAVSRAPLIAGTAAAHYRGTVVYEGNQGGEFVRNAILAACPDADVQAVYASQGKRVRAEDVVTLYDLGMVSHVGELLKLEKEMTTWNATVKAISPGRIDALVHSIKWLKRSGGSVSSTTRFRSNIGVDEDE